MHEKVVNKIDKTLRNSCILAITVAFFVFGCSGHSERSDSSGKLTGRYIGTFPCADCSGLRVDLTLKPDSGYILRRTYIASPNGDTTFVRKGIWATRKRNRYNPGAILCVLNPGDPTRSQLFRVIPPDTLLQLDREGRKINSPFNASLVRENGL